MSHNVVAMILAGGKGTRLGLLTKKMAKPAVSFAAKYRIIDFPLSNCANTGISTVGVLTQYESTILDSYIGNGEKWGYNGVHSLVTSIAPRQTDEGANWYKGTADAITQNIVLLLLHLTLHALCLLHQLAHIARHTAGKSLLTHCDSPTS